MSGRSTLIKGRVRNLYNTKIYEAIGPRKAVEVDLFGLDSTGTPGVSITTRDSALAYQGWMFSWETTAAMISGKIQKIARGPTMDLWIEGLYPYLKPFSDWEIPEKLDELLLAVVTNEKSPPVTSDGTTVYTNSTYRKVASPTATAQHDDHLRSRGVYSYELDNAYGGLGAEELRDMGLEYVAFVETNEDKDTTDLTDAVVLGTFRLGSVVVKTPQTTIYSASRLFEPPEGERDRIEARAYVVNDIDPKLRKYRLRSIARLIDRTVATSWLRGQYVVIYKADGFQEDEGGDTDGAVSGHGAPVVGDRKTEAQREKARIKQRDRRQRARAKNGEDRGLESSEDVSEIGTRIEGTGQVHPPQRPMFIP